MVAVVCSLILLLSSKRFVARLGDILRGTWVGVSCFSFPPLLSILWWRCRLVTGPTGHVVWRSANKEVVSHRWLVSSSSSSTTLAVAPSALLNNSSSSHFWVKGGVLLSQIPFFKNNNNNNTQLDWSQMEKSHKTNGSWTVHLLFIELCQKHPH